MEHLGEHSRGEVQGGKTGGGGREGRGIGGREESGIGGGGGGIGDREGGGRRRTI